MSNDNEDYRPDHRAIHEKKEKLLKLAIERARRYDDQMLSDTVYLSIPRDVNVQLVGNGAFVDALIFVELGKEDE